MRYHRGTWVVPIPMRSMVVWFVAFAVGCTTGTPEYGAPYRGEVWIDAEGVAGKAGLTHELFYPEHEGTGLVVYPWQDDDGDGVLCAPGAGDEAVGITGVEAWPAHALLVSVTLDAVCRGAEGLWPE